MIPLGVSKGTFTHISATTGHQDPHINRPQGPSPGSDPHPRQLPTRPGLGESNNRTLARTGPSNKRSQGIRDDAEHCVEAAEVERTDVEKQEHRHQEAHKGSDEPEETEALLHAIPRGNDDRDERQRNEKDRERECFATIVYIGELVDAEGCASTLILSSTSWHRCYTYAPP